MSVIGIDLGTTNSCVGVWRNNRIEIIASNQGNRTTPSWVAFTSTERYIGDAAVLQLVRNSKNTVSDVKRLIGRTFDDPVVQEDMKLWPFNVVNVEGKPRIQVEYKKQTKMFAPEEISAMVLGKMKEIAEMFIGGEVKGAVITVPAYFNNAQRQATIDAGKIAGLEVLRIINEPTAAALAYGHSMMFEKKRNILIYDLGGGTFDVSVVTVKEGTEFDVMASTGDTHLGGSDFDALLVKHLADEFLKDTGMNVFDNNNKKYLFKLKLKAKEAKHMLSSNLSYNIFIDSFMSEIDLNIDISRACFENLSLDLLQSTLGQVKRALEDAKLTTDDIDEVVLIGGSTRIPMVRKLLQEFFPGKSIKATINPDEAVAYGAALQAAILSCDTSIKFTNLVNDITSVSLGINSAPGDLMHVVIPRNTQIPCNISAAYNTSLDHQEAILFKVLEGERKFSKDNHLLDSFRLTGIPPAPAGEGKGLITFNLDANGILTVTAVDKPTGKTISTVIKVKEKGLTEEEIECMRKDAEKYREDDEDQMKIAREKHELELLVKNRLKI